MDPSIQIVNLSHEFDGRPVLKNIELSVQTGEILVVMGSSGGGKTTLLKCVGGLIIPTSGDVFVHGHNFRTEPDKARHHVGFVFQQAALFDSMTVEENVVFGALRKSHMGSREAKQTAEVLLTQVGLPGIQNQMPDALSGGMRKRVGLARALAMQPDVILFDEPTSGLDPVTAYAIDQLIVQTRDHVGAACIVVSHDISSVLRVADTVLFLHQGDAVFLGSTKDFRHAEHPAIQELIGKSRAETLESRW